MITCTFEDGKPAYNGTLRHCVVDGLIIKDGKILLVKRAAHLLEGGKWALVGGFIDPGEIIVEALHREIIEEVGWEISEPTLMQINDNPNRPNEQGRQNISFVFICEPTQKVRDADDESSDQQWFGLDDLPELAFDHIEYITLYKKHLAEPQPLPILGRATL